MCVKEARQKKVNVKILLIHGIKKKMLKMNLLIIHNRNRLGDLENKLMVITKEERSEGRDKEGILD